ncbi:MAG: GGDEF domain-containing protein [Ruminococcus sp.]|nr:GGDEF domain-containing protein [Ruminococcus sp.]
MAKRIAVIVAGIDETYQSSILRGIQSAALKYGFHCYVFVSFTGMKDNKGHDDGEMNIFKLPDFSLFDGAILLTNTIDCPPVVNDILSRIKKAGIPAVSMDNNVEGHLHIGIDNCNAMRDITEHFIKIHGFKRINYISGPMDNPESADRIAAFLKVMKENGIEVEQQRIYYGDFRENSGREAIDYFLEGALDMPDAIICANDVMAASAVNRLFSAGIKVPEDIAVSGFDDVFESYNMRVELTTVERPLVRSGKLACKMLNNVFNNSPQQESIMLNMLPKYTESCGCVKCVTRDADDYKEANIGNFNRIGTINQYMSLFNSLSCELSGADNFKEYIEIFKKFVLMIDPGEFYFCLNEKWNYQSEEIYNILHEDKLQKCYEENINVPIAYCNGRFIDDVHISLKQLLPQFEFDENFVKFYYFLPLHFRERCMGYMAINNCALSLHNALFQSWCITINNSLENIRKINAMDFAVKKLEKLYIQDTFSGIYNRNGFVNATNDVFRQCASQARNVMLMFIDLDGLKKINDTYGHAIGDEAIRAIAKILEDSCKKDEIFCRFGGDEFIVFAADYSDSDAAGLTANIQKKIMEYNSKNSGGYTLSASTGYVIAVPKIGEDLFRFVTEADKKMYETKREKKSKYLRAD